MPDVSDLTDAERKRCMEITWALRKAFGHRLNTRANLDEFAKTAKEAFMRAGFIVDVDLMPCIIANARGEIGPPEIVVLRKANPEVDHEYKRWEIMKAKQRGEEYLGDKDNYTGQREPGK